MNVNDQILHISYLHECVTTTDLSPLTRLARCRSTLRLESM